MCTKKIRNAMSLDDVMSVRPFMNEGTNACANGYRRGISGLPTKNNHHDNRRVQCDRNTMSSDDVRSVRPFMNEGTDACAKGYRRTMVRYRRLPKSTDK